MGTTEGTPNGPRRDSPRKGRLLNRRYKDSAANCTGGTFAARADPPPLDHASIHAGISFALPANAAIFRIFQNYTTLRELFSDAVCVRKVPLFPRYFPFG